MIAEILIGTGAAVILCVQCYLSYNLKKIYRYQRMIVERVLAIEFMQTIIGRKR